MLKLAKPAALAVAGVLMAAPAFSADNAAATVNGHAIPQTRVDMRLKEVTSQGRPATAQLRQAVIEDTINLELLSQEAAKKGFDKQPEAVEQMVMLRQSVLARALVQDYVKKHPVSDDVLKQEYDKQKAALGTSEYKVAHILVASEADAKAIAAQLKDGGDFAKIAKEKSTDPGSKENGGEMDWTVPSAWVPPFAAAVTKLSKGQISEPVKSEFGWHIIKLVDTRALNVPSFDQAKPELMQRAQQQTVQNLIADLRKNAKIKKN